GSRRNRGTGTATEGVAAEFFAGMGLVRRALEAPSARGRRWRTDFANDLDPLKSRLYRAYFPGAADHYHEGDIHALSAADLPEADLWTASFPCTDLSLAGRGAGIHAGQSGAVWGLLRLLESIDLEKRPSHLLFENVLGLLSSHGGADLRALVSAVNDLGFGVDPVCVNAAHFVPQSRPRLFLIATRLDLALVERADVDSIEPATARPARIIAAMGRESDLIWHARQTPPLPSPRHALADILESLDPEDERWWPAPRAKYFFEQIHPEHRLLAQRMIDRDRVTAAAAFRRVRPVGEMGADGLRAKRSVIELRSDGIAGCLRTPKGGSAKQMLFQAGRGEYQVRFLTALEAARLQGLDGVPEGFSENELLFGLGDAVCVPAVRWVLDLLSTPAPAAGQPRLFASASPVEAV
ncbi:MAG: DNA (cytosine-5-)-methyltransferase, partial [Planctomycetota bacterium]|nr:DNA (cytosine-5-)-methyltransferase [Planctomycetota bacterium]